MKKTVDFLDRLTDLGLQLLFLLCFAAGLYGLYDSCMIYVRTVDDSLLRYKPGYSQEEEPEKEIQGNMVAWLSFSDAGIDCPVMQGEDNTEYLSKNPYGEYSLAGSIFLDARNAPDFTDGYSLLYGHHMEGGLMFGSLDHYLNEAWFFSCEDGTLSVRGKEYPLKVFAVLESEFSVQEIFAPTETDPEETFRYIKSKARYYDPAREPDLGSGGHILALSTCKNPDTPERTVVFCAYETFTE